MKKVISYWLLILLTTFFCCPQPVSAYSVLTHEAIIDVSIDSFIKPLLVKKYPAATDSELKDAYAYAYGGAVAPDMGYYPFGSKLFTNLIHYVRTGDFVNALLDESQNINEYAFALGFLCHYYADKYGHHNGTNKCVPMVYTKDKDKYGPVVTYEQDPVSHIRMEFGFDILQTARGNYASEKYHSFIGFKIARPVLERAFLKTYGLDINKVFKDLTLTISTFRWVIKDIFPTLTRAAWSSKKGEIVKSNPGMTRRKFEYKMRRANYYHEFGKKREKPGFFPSVLAVIFKVTPKIGPLKGLKLKVPGPEAEKVFIQSFDTVQARYIIAIKSMSTKNICLTNIDYDTGNETTPGEYSLADKTYAELLLKLNDDHFSHVEPGLKQNIIKFYRAGNEKTISADGADKAGQTTSALNSLKALSIK
ncbi:MAG: zinc dependent phospholipase C family protein [Taibaiella sp.]|nr:zinc dependent phospholipase C family protein [Taibaiella sp.]